MFLQSQIETGKTKQTTLYSKRARQQINGIDHHFQQNQ